MIQIKDKKHRPLHQLKKDNKSFKIGIPIIAIAIGLFIILYPTFTDLRFHVFQNTLQSMLGDQEDLGPTDIGLLEKGAIAGSQS